MPIRPSVAHSYKHLILLQRSPVVTPLRINAAIYSPVLADCCQLLATATTNICRLECTLS
jgi:hypothetical protein